MDLLWLIVFDCWLALGLFLVGYGLRVVACWLVCYCCLGSVFVMMVVVWFVGVVA